MPNQLNQFNPPFWATQLDCALAASGKANPTWAELAPALAVIYPAGDGPTVAEIVAAGWLEPCISDKMRLRERPQDIEAGARLEEVRRELSETVNPLLAPGPLFSYYEGPISNTKPRASITLADLHKAITNPPRSLRLRANAARAAYELHGKGDLYNQKKCCLDYFTAAGIFPPGKRKADTVAERSGLMIVDFDGVRNVPAALAALLADKVLVGRELLVMACVSPSGNGLKAVVRAELSADHLTNFNTYAAYLAGQPELVALGLVPDVSGKDVCRPCFVPYDPAAWLAPAYRYAA